MPAVDVANGVGVRNWLVLLEAAMGCEPAAPLARLGKLMPSALLRELVMGLYAWLWRGGWWIWT